MHWIDLLLFLPLLWGLYKGFGKGFIAEVISLITLVVAVFLGIKLMDSFSGWLMEKVGTESNFVPLLAFAIVFLSVLVAGYISSRILSGLAGQVALGGVNKLAGAAFGAIKMLMIVSLGLFMINLVDEKLRVVPEQFKSESLLYQPLSKFAMKAIPAVRNSETFQQLQDLKNQSGIDSTLKG